MNVVGRRNPALLHPVPAANGLVPTGQVIACGHKPMRLGAETYTYGERVPGAEHWDRLEARFRSRIIVTLPVEQTTEHIDTVTDHPDTLDQPDIDGELVTIL